MIFLSADDCRHLLDPAAVLDAVEEALRMEHAGTVRWSSPRSMRVAAGAEGGGRLRVKACALDTPGITGVRLLLFPDAGADTRWVLVFDDATGEPLGIVDEAWTYLHRSIASIALLAHRLRSPDVHAVGLIGAGRIARAALPYVDRLFPGASLLIASRREETRAALAALAGDRYGLEADPVPIEQAVRDTQVVLACTSAASAIIEDGWVGPGGVVGSLEPRECDPSLFARADLRIVDSREQLRDELAETFGPDAHERIDATMAEVIAGAHPGRTDEGQRIIVLSQGLVSQDVLLAARACNEAMARGMGTAIPISSGADPA
jgi:ornithine cyclodeaminase/alanine dehydrogenase-like protein (mu-crystallin family)